MTEEEILEMGAKPKKTKSKSITKDELEAMFAKHEESINRRLEEVQRNCDECQHHECGCPEKIEQQSDRMDVIDQNVETVQGNLEKTYEVLKGELNEEHRLRVEAEERIADHESDIRELEHVNQRMKSDNLKLGIMAGICLGLCLCVLAIFMAS